MGDEDEGLQDAFRTALHVLASESTRSAAATSAMGMVAAVVGAIVPLVIRSGTTISLSGALLWSLLALLFVVVTLVAMWVAMRRRRRTWKIRVDRATQDSEFIGDTTVRRVVEAAAIDRSDLASTAPSARILSRYAPAAGPLPFSLRMLLGVESSESDE